jgi:hypothetical protein
LRLKKFFIIKSEPNSETWFRRWLGGEEFINNIERWCLWLGDCRPEEIRHMPEAIKFIEAVQKFRNSSNSLPTRKLAATPTRFHTEFMCGDKLCVIENATLYYFGILTSTLHMSWTRQVCGRLKGDYQYSGLIVYNNVSWHAL